MACTDNILSEIIKMTGALFTTWSTLRLGTTKHDEQLKLHSVWKVSHIKKRKG